MKKKKLKLFLSTFTVSFLFFSSVFIAMKLINESDTILKHQGNFFQRKHMRRRFPHRLVGTDFEVKGNTLSNSTFRRLRRETVILPPPFEGIDYSKPSTTIESFRKSMPKLKSSAVCWNAPLNPNSTFNLKISGYIYFLE